MDVEPNDLVLFARVADAGSFTRAAERLRLPKSTVSRRLAALEAQLGERLLLRTTRKLTVTDFGMSVLEHARQIVAEVDAAADFAQHRQVLPSGRLRVSLPGDFATVVMGSLLADFVARYPAVSLEIDVSPRRVDLIGENFDVAIRMGDLPDDATLAARRLALFSGSLYAAPHYLATPRGSDRTRSADGARRTAPVAAQRRADAVGVEPGRPTLGGHPAGTRYGQLAGIADPVGAPRGRHYDSE